MLGFCEHDNELFVPQNWGIHLSAEEVISFLRTLVHVVNEIAMKLCLSK